ncbi:PREDICTED: uncharacterized protein K02A2.6-like [Vollenhovia emeryi]|uniref:uncharacterized protein K02A2.6-like n=1 Tax=Vollenhovia emeryi TaxID=411798 RepID=UPI0005F4573C|nr:PREDICTED: uncharacterized protein K02A2.6-like [Vollenhovia emeryi]
MATNEADRKVVPGTFSIEPFDLTKNWDRWKQRLEGAFSIFGITGEDRVPYFLHYVGATSFDILCDRLAPDDPFAKPYENLKGILKEFYAPVPLEIAENFKFHQRKQKEGEEVKDFMAALRKLSINCNFGNYLPTALRNQLVFGLSCKRTQARLLEIQDLNLDKALKIATTMELSEKGMLELQGDSASINIVAVKKSQYKKNPKKQEAAGSSALVPKSQAPKTNNLSSNFKPKCYRCGKDLASKCTLNQNVRCNACGKAGHLQRVCFQAKQSTNHLDEVLNLSGDHNKAREKIKTTLQVNDRSVEFEIDTGAAVSVIGTVNARKIFPGLTIRKSDLKLSLGRVEVNVKSRDKQISLDLFLTPGECKPLLGREWSYRLQNMPKIAEVYQKCVSINTIESTINSQVALLIKDYEANLDPKSSKIKGLHAELNLKEGARPVFHKARTVPFKLVQMIDKELDRLCNEGVLEKVNVSRWATPIVPVLKKNNQVRICGDFSVTLNPNLIVDEHPLPTTNELFTSMEGCTIFSKIDLQNAYLQLEVRKEDCELLMLNTHRGLYKCKRLMYGIASAPAI